MSYATLMLYVEADAPPEQRVRLAAGLADKFTATLIGVSALAFRPPVVTDGKVVGGVTDAEIEDMRAKFAEAEARFRHIAAAGQRKLEWRADLDYPTSVLAREARSADLLVIGQPDGWVSVYRSLDVGGAILKAGRPILLAPKGVNSVRAEHIVIGWKDTREARRAVIDALPFLHEAERVTVVEVCDADEKALAQKRITDVAHYLARHRIKAEPQAILGQEASDATQLTRFAGEQGADLLVTGAYGHSRLGEWMFGGVTRELLASSSICCLMSH
jgi:nucleotide-binding universal stress UspA family protein